jgi:hypothetical protein
MRPQQSPSSWPWSGELDELEGGGPLADVNTVLPRSGPGFYSYHPGSPGRQYGTAGAIRSLQAIGLAWAAAHPAGPRIGVGDISFRGGGRMPPHVSHDKGLDVDLRIMRNDRQEGGTTYREASYSRALTQRLVDTIRANQVLPIKLILFNDPQVTGVKPWKGHDNHLHVRFTPSVPGQAPPTPRGGGGPGRRPLPGNEAVLVEGRLAAGVRDENALTDLVFLARHPELAGQRLRKGQEALMAEWRRIRAEIVRPALSGGGRATPPGPAPTPAATDKEVLAAVKRWNLPTGLPTTPLFAQLVDRWRPPHLPLPLLVAFSSLEAFGWTDATHGTKRNCWTRPAFYELGVFQVPAGLHGSCSSGPREDCNHQKCQYDPPGRDPQGKSPWFRICHSLGLDPLKWTDPTTQVRVGVQNLETDAATVRRLHPRLFPDKGSDWALRASVLMPFGPGIGYTLNLLKTHRAQLELLPESARWAFLRARGAVTAKVDDKMTRARKLAQARGTPSAMP